MIEISNSRSIFDKSFCARFMRDCFIWAEEGSGRA